MRVSLLDTTSKNSIISAGDHGSFCRLASNHTITVQRRTQRMSLSFLLLVLVILLWTDGILMAKSAAAENSENIHQHRDNHHPFIILKYYDGEQTQPELVQYDSPWKDPERQPPVSSTEQQQPNTSSLLSYYTPDLWHVLRRYRPHFDHPLDEAAWLVDLGVAHRSVLLQAEEEEATTNDAILREHERRAILACKAAIQIYQGWLLDHDDDNVLDNNAAVDTAMPQSQRQAQHHRDFHHDDQTSTHIVQHELASTYFCLAEIYRNSLTEHSKIADDYYDQAYRLWETLLLKQQWVVEDRREMELSVAYCALHLGAALLEQPSSSDHVNFATEDLLSGILVWMSTASSSSGDDSQLWDLADDWMSGSTTTGTTTMEELQRLLEQLSGSNNDFSIHIDHLAEAYQRQLQLLQRAERYLLQAIASFRRNKESETDSLASALQHGGTVAAALGHGTEAVARYEEALNLLYYNSNDDDDAAAGMSSRVNTVAQVLLSLSDAYLQLTKYDEAHDRYQKASEYCK